MSGQASVWMINTFSVVIAFPKLDGSDIWGDENCWTKYWIQRSRKYGRNRSLQNQRKKWYQNKTRNLACVHRNFIPPLRLYVKSILVEIGIWFHEKFYWQKNRFLSTLYNFDHFNDIPEETSWRNEVPKKVEQRHEKLIPKWFAKEQYRLWQTGLLRKTRIACGRQYWWRSSKGQRDISWICRSTCHWDRRNLECFHFQVGIENIAESKVKPWIVWSSLQKWE